MKLGLLMAALATLVTIECRAAETLADAGASRTANEQIVTPDSPRASLTRYLDLCRAGRYAEAAEYLAAPASRAYELPVLAQHLKAVLDRYIWFDLANVSPESEGRRDDGLPAEIEQVGLIPASNGAREPVLMAHLPAKGKWVFARDTVEKIDVWYATLENRYLLDHLPGWLLRPGPRDLLRWQWLALGLLLFVAAAAGLVASWATRAAVARVVKRTETHWDDTVLSKMRGPLVVGWMVAFIYFGLHPLALYAPAERFIHQLLRGVIFVDFFWTLARLIDVGGQIAKESLWGKNRAASGALIPLASRVAKVTVLAMAVVALLSELGYPVASLVAGLGIGGVAVALAAQKTVENLFGAFSISVDQPFREGDFVKVEDFVGTVEAIGLRSTKIRTLDRTLVTVPNGKLADIRLESFAARDRIRLACTLGLVYGTSARQMREVLAELERVLRSHPKIWPDAVVVRFKEFGDSALNIEIMAWFLTADWGEFQLIRQDMLLDFMEVVEKAGSSFAFPTRTVHVVGESSVAGG